MTVLIIFRRFISAPYSSSLRCPRKLGSNRFEVGTSDLIAIGIVSCTDFSVGRRDDLTVNFPVEEFFRCDALLFRLGRDQQRTDARFDGSLPRFLDRFFSILIKGAKVQVRIIQNCRIQLILNVARGDRNIIDNSQRHGRDFTRLRRRWLSRRRCRLG